MGVLGAQHSVWFVPNAMLCLLTNGDGGAVSTGVRLYGRCNTPNHDRDLTWLFRPRGVQFFGLFGLTNRASSVVGPNVIQVIIDKTGNIWQGFPFLFAMCLASSLVIWFAVDIPKGRQDAERWAVEQRGSAYLAHLGQKG